MVTAAAVVVVARVPTRQRRAPTARRHAAPPIRNIHPACGTSKRVRVQPPSKSSAVSPAAGHTRPMCRQHAIVTHPASRCAAACRAQDRIRRSHAHTRVSRRSRAASQPARHRSAHAATHASKQCMPSKHPDSSMSERAFPSNRTAASAAAMPSGTDSTRSLSHHRHHRHHRRKQASKQANKQSQHRRTPQRTPRHTHRIACRRHR